VPAHPDRDENFTMGLFNSAYAPLALVIGYLLGSIPFGLLLTRAAGRGDLRKIGSGNIGATNVLRTGSKGLAAATLALDALKGTVAVILARESAKGTMALEAYQLGYVAALGALLGHVFPVWLYFEGGKGVATFIGALLGLHWPAALAFGVVWCAVAVATRYSSLAALTAALAVALYYLLLGQAGLLFIMIMVIVIFGKHHANIRRLTTGEEHKIGA
jgi:acyl phosphate:glycerol-3-phosphate acyltransferase